MTEKKLYQINAPLDAVKYGHKLAETRLQKWAVKIIAGVDGRPCHTDTFLVKMTTITTAKPQSRHGWKAIGPKPARDCQSNLRNLSHD